MTLLLKQKVYVRKCTTNQLKMEQIKLGLFSSKTRNSNYVFLGYATLIYVIDHI